MEPGWYFEASSKGSHSHYGTDGTALYEVCLDYDDHLKSWKLNLCRQPNLKTHDCLLQLHGNWRKGWTREQLREIFREIVKVPPGGFDFDAWKMTEAL